MSKRKLTQYQLVDEWAENSDQIVAICWATSYVDAMKVFDQQLNKGIDDDHDDFIDVYSMEASESNIDVIYGGRII